ncbi:MAG: 23S rRNA (cytidine(2498)-2'-O)-methyltransferase RlmM [Pseudomonadota bacterium]|jgi:23S rRNA (cytidine2498-2'-O)-methyltransferase|uniref:23S rRNA (cytidine(2498)-2'-O)-methyltransferase RlmM n=1 Tax=Alteromonas sp. MmMcT2-5 TaxID=2917733 RepID=UPI001EF3BF62|nr:23S rRNA (cytidine(2498)-2'-O)-methyltransferase RlmM [Alteromonas sp. MmMcT2-5]MCG7650105.1 23S rRNA (cytidine(2498)-2'-O)-methyltransferase RlmM [Alteromonas sp. MmMcT2-5]MEC8903129.1 23S rRNA (cytidine(2498)-2'-O)-methyltransferase RlmM [Pseudomonadota bacterium]
MSNTSILGYCRPGYENDTANELTSRYGEAQCYGYPLSKKNSGFVLYHLYDGSQLEQTITQFAVHDSIFPRQLVAVFATLNDIEKLDRVGQVLEALKEVEKPFQIFGAIDVEYPDTEEGKTLAKFCRKFTVPLRQALRKAGWLTAKENLGKPKLHIFFESFEICHIGYTLPSHASGDHLGICRLKFPSDAPSRSTLKLEDALVNMLSDKQQAKVLRSGGRAVDLGACPGGWTYQLVKRGMYVEAIDNGLVADSLMSTGLVEHHAADGFTYRPQFGRVDLLVCDMIEQPDRVAKLMGDWLVKHWATHAIFNLKLPMKQRYETVVEAMTLLRGRLNALEDAFAVKVRHLYHDRDEVTVTIVRTSKDEV